ncbi:ATP-dependent RNA helicase [archaeon]|nr:ATP-dependent RNA helicase [archaeon]
MKFEDIGLDNETVISINKLGITIPTEIQGKSIPLILEGKDVIGESATGSGKTLAFGCGITEHVESKQGLQSLILTPTRELAEQVKESLKKLAANKQLKVISVYGGVSINPQIYDLKKAEVVVGTPGRLLDHLQRGTIDTSKINLLVLDEADRMFDMGFLDDVERIIESCPKERQTLCFSATISEKVKNLANRYMKNPAKVAAKNQVDPSKLKQAYYDIHKGMKFSLLVHLLQKEKNGLVMVFCNTRRNTDFVVKNLKSNKIDAIAIHGGLTQNKRTRTIDMFNSTKVNVLVCTDVAARGLHIDNVSHIYNYDIPKDPKDYVHRIGRTARAEEEGQVINLLCDYDYDNFGRIQNDYRSFVIDKLEKPYVDRVETVRDNFNGNSRFRNGNRNGNSRNFRRGNSGRSRGGSSNRFGNNSNRFGNSSRGNSNGFRKGNSKFRGNRSRDSDSSENSRNRESGRSRGNNSSRFRNSSNRSGNSRKPNFRRSN